MNTYYVSLRTPKDRCGCRGTAYKVIEADNKTAIRNKYKGTGYGINYIWSEKELNELPKKDVIIRMAR